MDKKRFYRYGRRGLLILMGVSFVFFATIVTLRVNRDAQRYVIRNYSTELFQFDVIAHKTKARFSDTEGQHKVAQSLIVKGFYSPIYYRAGTKMMKDLADQGYAPSQVSYGDALLREERFYQSATLKPRYYYTLAAQQDYAPAYLRLAELDSK